MEFEVNILFLKMFLVSTGFFSCYCRIKPEQDSIYDYYEYFNFK